MPSRKGVVASRPLGQRRDWPRSSGRLARPGYARLAMSSYAGASFGPTCTTARDGRGKSTRISRDLAEEGCGARRVPRPWSWSPVTNSRRVASSPTVWRRRTADAAGDHDLARELISATTPAPHGMGQRLPACRKTGRRGACTRRARALLASARAAHASRPVRDDGVAPPRQYDPPGQARRGRREDCARREVLGRSRRFDTCRSTAASTDPRSRGATCSRARGERADFTATRCRRRRRSSLTR